MQTEERNQPAHSRVYQKRHSHYKGSLQRLRYETQFDGEYTGTCRIGKTINR